MISFDTATTPNVSFEDRKQLPKTAGIYIVVQNSTILYVGRATNLRHRWTKHHRAADLDLALGEVRIHYIEMTHADACAVEQSYIAQLRPTLNGRTNNPQQGNSSLPNAPLCPCCGVPQRVFEQPALLPGRLPTLLADCREPLCSLYMVTLALGAHALLTAEDIAGYRAASPFAKVDLRPMWRGETPDAETVRQIQETFGTSANKRLIAGLALQAANHEEVPA